MGQATEEAEDAVGDAEGPLQGEVPQELQAPNRRQAGIGQLAAAVELHPVQPSKHAQLGIHLHRIDTRVDVQA